MARQGELKRLLAWLDEGGRTVKWFASKVGYSYQSTWNKIHGHGPITELFVVRCFSRIPELPSDTFERFGYCCDDMGLVKLIPLEGETLEELLKPFPGPDLSGEPPQFEPKTR